MIKLVNILKEILLTELNKQQLDTIAKTLGTERSNEFDSKLNSLNAKGLTYPDILKQVKDGVSQGKSSDEIINDLSSTVGKSSKDLASDFETIVDNENVIVQVPHTHEASRKLGLTTFAFRDCKAGGKDSAWCTTHGKRDYWNEHYYDDNETLYYVRAKSPEIISQIKKELGADLEVAAIVVQNDEITAMFDGQDLETNDQDEIFKYIELLGLNEFIFTDRRSEEERYASLVANTEAKIQDYIKNGSEGDLDLKDLPLVTLPKNLTKVGGNLDLSNSPITSLPDTLTVDGTLNLSNCKNLTTIPDGITFKNVIIKGSSITKVSSRVSQTLDAGAQKLIQNYIRKGSKGDLDLSGTPISSLPDGLVVDGTLNLSNCKNLTTLPGNLKAKMIDLGGSNITNISSKLKTDTLILKNTPITTLPDNLKVNTIYANNSNLSEIPNKLSVYRFIAYNTPLAKKYSSSQVFDMILKKGGKFLGSFTATPDFNIKLKF